MYSFIETKLFSRLLGDYLTDDEYAEVQAALVETPERAVYESCAGPSLAEENAVGFASSTTRGPTKASSGC